MWPGNPRCLSRPYLVEAVLHPVPAQLTHALPRGVFDQRFDARRGHLEDLAATYRPLGNSSKPVLHTYGAAGYAALSCAGPARVRSA